MIEMRDKMTSLGALVVVGFLHFCNFDLKNVEKMKMKIKTKIGITGETFQLSN